MRSERAARCPQNRERYGNEKAIAFVIGLVLGGLLFERCVASAGTDDAIRAVRALERIAIANERAANAAGKCSR